MSDHKEKKAPTTDDIINEDADLVERHVGPQTYFFDSPLNILLIVIFLPTLFLLLPRVIWLLQDPKLPPSWIRPSALSALENVGLSAEDTGSCRNLNAAQNDPWKRNSAFHSDPEVQQLANCEDAKLIQAQGVAILACDPGRTKWNTVMGFAHEAEPRGALWVWDYIRNTESPNLIDVQGFPEDAYFHPLGMHIHEKAPGNFDLYVVNHGKVRSSIERFALRAGTGDKDWAAQYVRTYQNPIGTHTPNAIAQLDADTLLITNDHLFVKRPPPVEDQITLHSQMLGVSSIASYTGALAASAVAPLLSEAETLLGTPSGFVASLDLTTGESSIVAKGIAFANGIAVSPKATTIAVASTMGPAIRLYQAVRHATTGKLASLKLVDKAHTPMLVDNIDFTWPIWEDARAQTPAAKEGKADLFDGARLVASGHPRALQLPAFAKNPSKADAQSGTWSVTMEPAGPAPAENKVELHAFRASQDGAPVPAAKRTMTSSNRWLFKTLYQAQKGFEHSFGFGVASGATAAWDPSDQGRGALIVAGLYSRGVLACVSAGLE